LAGELSRICQSGRGDAAMKVAGVIGFAAGAATALICSSHTSACGCIGLRQLIDELPQCRNIDEMLGVIEDAFTGAFGFPFALLLMECDAVWVRYHSPGFLPVAEDLTRAAHSVAIGAMVRDIRDGQDRYFIPLIAARGYVGAFAFAAKRKIRKAEWDLIRSFANQVGMSVFRTRLQDQAQQASALTEADRFQKTLLDSIAHNVRTPLASIIGSLSSLQEDAAVLNGEIRIELVETARQEAERLHRLLRNLLDLSRLESGSVHVRTDPCEIQDLIGAALEQLGSAARSRPVEISIDPKLPLVPMDFVLIVQVIVNLLDNAFKYSPADRPVVIQARLELNSVAISVADEGDGISERDLGRIFSKFNRAGRSTEGGGIGLGLSICRGLIEAHHGTISAARKSPRGTIITFTLPVQVAADENRTTA
jgi:K+-sensing histidine kinase KdpD